MTTTEATNFTEELIEQNLNKAAKAVSEADFVVFTAGAGLGVDSGLPDFRGPEGFWRAYPPMKELGLKFEQMSNPRWFSEDPCFAWGFFGHRFQLYTTKKPHEGYHIMRKIADKIEKRSQAKFKDPQLASYFVFTSNVDGHFEQVFPENRIEECHGAIRHLQCHKLTHPKCETTIWKVENEEEFRDKLKINEKTFKVEDKSLLPTCPNCGGLARPNVLMFGDFGWLADRNDIQSERFLSTVHNWKSGKYGNPKIVIIEAGAGIHVPTIRMKSESLTGGSPNGTLIRLNPRDLQTRSNLGDKYIPLPLGGKDAMQRIQQALEKMNFFE